MLMSEICLQYMKPPWIIDSSVEALLIPEQKEKRIKKKKKQQFFQNSSKEESILSMPVAQCGRAAETFGLFLSHSWDVKVQRLVLQKQH